MPGPRVRTPARHRPAPLFGTVTSYEPDAGRLMFSPTGGHPPLALPVHRIVALAGDRQRRSDGQLPAHTPYDG
ncbi:hypothetical protein [Streptomyces flaveolus]|uniref:hypothetical protein n=1 Tax=Streptomyces flaveolus TaxID=67297 RepID=UPI00331A4477